ncbi:MAG: ribosomal L7Ae/L30e/S12e/Gadd45 family protein [Firmicutes bacterium]|nr:ribosomal L7Ae/L30e/S12e/Gadd45 family protein [Bacillota bacterium]
MNEAQRARVAGYLGLAQRAGKIAAGDTAAKTALLKGRACLLVLAEDASAAVREELLALAGSDVPVLFWPDKNDLGLIVGKSRRGALALLDEGFAGAIAKVLAPDTDTAVRRK